MVAIQAVINRDFVERLTALSRGEKREGAAVARALQGQAAESSLSSGLRFGAQFYAKALSGINFAGSFVNFARSDLQQLSDLTDKMIGVVSEAADLNGSRSDRLKANRELTELGNDFEEILDGAVVGDRGYLTKQGIEEVFVSIGLDPNEDRSLKAVFNKFETVADGVDERLADPDIKGDDTKPPKGAGRARTVHESEGLFDGGRVITRPADAIAILDDLEALSTQIKNNITVMDDLTEELSANAFLVRSTALAMLEVGDALNSEDGASEVAKSLQRMITQNSRQALTHADNLEPIIVATLAYDEAGIVTN